MEWPQKAALATPSSGLPRPNGRLVRFEPSTLAAFFHAVESPIHQAEVKTRNRKPLAAPLDEMPIASWEVRAGAWRILYEVKKRGRIVRILRVILKGRQTTKDALGEKP